MFEVWVNGGRVASFETREAAKAYIAEEGYNMARDDVLIIVNR